MVHYRRNRLPGGTCFFTVTLANRRSHALTDHIDLLRTALRTVHRTQPFHTVAMVVLPEHLHALWTLPEGDADYPARWQSIKSRFTHALAARGIAIPRNPRGEHRLWQPRYWEHTIRDEADLQTHVDYIHYNPVKHGWAARPVDWPYSSFHRYVRQGWLSRDWGSATVESAEGRFGE